MKKKIAFHTLGCKLNFSETSTIARLLQKQDFERVSFNEKADIYIINTCSVTNSAEKKCRNAIKKAIKISPKAFVAVIGCYAQLRPKEILQINGVNIVLGTNEKFNLIHHIENLDKKTIPEILSCEIEKVNQFDDSFSLGDRTRSFLKVQDGCDYFCTYCTIPLARGKSRNNKIENIVRQANEIASQNVKEIILTGVNIGDFGHSTNENFIDLIRALDEVENIERFRISSIEPNLLSNEIIEFVAKSKKFVPHFHIPLQSGCDKILTLMKRRYKRDLFKNRVTKIKSVLPNASIGVDVIVGFPSETKEDFLDTFQFLNFLDISYLHVFSYSERPNTKAILIKEKVNPKDKKERSQLLHTLSAQKENLFYQKNIGNLKNILLEGQKHENFMFGFTDNYLKVRLSYDKNKINKILNVKLENLNQENGNCFVI